MGTGKSFAQTNSGCSFHSVHHRHLYIHEYQVEGLVLKRCYRLSSISNHNNRVSPLGQNPIRHPLIDNVVFREQIRKGRHSSRLSFPFTTGTCSRAPLIAVIARESVSNKSDCATGFGR